MKIGVLLSVVLCLLVNAELHGGCSLQSGIAYAVPPGSTATGSVSFSPSGAYLAAANNSSANVTMFTVQAGGGLSAGTSYALPGGSSGPELVAFSPDNLYLATPNNLSNDVTIFSVGVGGVLSGVSLMLCLLVQLIRSRWHSRLLVAI